MPSVVAYFAGQTAGVSFDYTNAWGGSPSTATIAAPLSFGSINQVGDLTIRVEGLGSPLVLRQCRIARVSAGRSTTQGGLVEFVVEDRRWKWQYGGVIDGDYNVLQPDKTRLRKKNARELATLLFKQLGETGADVEVLPDFAYPRAEWYAASPLDELERLVESFGCVIVYNPLADRAEIRRIGQGAPPDFAGNLKKSESQAGSLVAPPDGIRIIGGPALYQSVLEFAEALGEDTDGKEKPLDELSYKPAAGWGKTDPTAFDAIEGTFTDKDGNERQLSDLAKGSVYRIYRLTKVNGGWSPASLQGSDYEPKGIDDIGPILAVRLEVDEKTKQRLPAVVRANAIDARYGDKNAKESSKYKGSWSIDSETKTLRLGEPAFKFKTDDDPTEIEPAKFSVVCAYGVLHEGVPIRYEQWRNNPNQTYGAGFAVEHQATLVREVIDDAAALSNPPSLDNLEAIEEQANYYLDALAEQFVTREAATITLRGIVPLVPTGLLRSVGWSAATTASPQTVLAYNAEPCPYVEPWESRKERRDKQTADAAARRSEQRVAKGKKART